MPNDKIRFIKMEWKIKLKKKLRYFKVWEDLARNLGKIRKLGREFNLKKLEWKQNNLIAIYRNIIYPQLGRCLGKCSLQAN